MTSTMSSIPTMSVPPAIKYIITFLVVPLQRTYSASTISIVITTLQHEFTAMLKSNNTNDGQWNFYLPLHPTLIPPRPILAACIASGIKWPRWILHLGGKAMTLGLSDKAVVAHFPATNVWMALWECPPSHSNDEEEDYATYVRRKYRWWQPPTASYRVDPDAIPVSPPRSCLWSSIGSAWRPDSPSRNSVLDDVEEEWEE